MDPINAIASPLAGTPVLSQFWRGLVFVHWRVDPAEIAPLLPEGIVPDVFDGATWVGLIPFEMRDSAVLGGLAIPYFGSFTEVNVRLYGMDRDGHRGVVFRSLEASRLAAVLVARTLFSLPYVWASASVERSDDVVTYRSRRLAPGRPASLVSVRTSAVEVVDDPLADFLTARWLLFVRRGAHTLSMPNEHASWQLFRADLLELDDDLVAAAGIASVGGRAPDSVLYSPGVVTRFGRPTRLA
ncbi:MAG: DUF2071 domain-containing protein [Burkholderiaceae bacterium]|nr:DUF2071 domain-containing protein [Microbacteriaceae bacterium]